MKRNILFIFVSSLLYSPVFTDEYYELLGISRDASTRDIRKAFKKLALKLHPDKNKDDRTAHETFTKITRAYEVLKDDELRKKYDMFGEEGLKDNQFGGGQYQSWSYFNEEFGIYDDDPEVITLSHSDFQVSVQGSEDNWFINYYSPYCSHCHDIAPTWRQVAQELEGVVRIGAVNCQEDWSLCQQQGIHSYPSLVLYPSHQFYRGQRTPEDLVKYIMESLDVRLFELWDENFDKEISDSTQPWLIEFCGLDRDCLSSQTRTKIAALLDNLVNVGYVECQTSPDLCRAIEYENDVVFFKDEVAADKGELIYSLETHEIVNYVLKLTPELNIMDREMFEEMREILSRASTQTEEQAWLIHFDKGPVTVLEMRKLPALLTDMNVGHVDCERELDLCRTLHITKFPAVSLFRPGGHEWHHGRYTAHDVAVFAKESASSNVQTLGPDDFPSRVIQAKRPFFVDFFAPWCPPCMRLLPEYRKVARLYVGREISFGTVDCTVHSHLCTTYNIRSYPTTILYNNSIPHQYSGHHSSQELSDFIENTLSPSVHELTPETFQSFITEKKKGETWLLDYFAPWCGPCQELAPDWNKLAKKILGEANVASVDCQKYRALCQEQGVTSYPTIRLYPHTSQGSWNFVKHNGWRDVHSLYTWAFQYLPSVVTPLNYRRFHSDVLNSRDPWLVDYYTPWCGHCVQFAPDYEKTARMLQGVVKVGKVNCEDEFQICSEMGIRMYPTVKLHFGSAISTTEPDHMVIQTKRPSDIHKVVMEAVERRRVVLNDATTDKKPGRSPPMHDEF